MPTTGGSRLPFDTPDLPDRVQRLLSALVCEYIEHGEPVSSHWLAGHAGYAVSSATVRNVLARLEEQGFVRQPHTSAGRVPTDRGYRRYVDSIMGARRPARLSVEVEARLRPAQSVPDMLAIASHEVSRASQHVGFALSTSEDGTLARIEFVPLEGARLLVIVMSTGGGVVHKVIDFDDGVTRDELVQSANYLTEEFAGLTLSEARARVIERLNADRVRYDELLARSLRLASTTLDALPADDRLVFIAGAPTLVDYGLSEDALPMLRTLLAMIEEKDRLVRLLTAYMEDSGLTVVIGSEHVSVDLQSLSLVATTYAEGSRTRTIGIIGPTRMRYSRAIAAVESVSHAIHRVLASD